MQQQLCKLRLGHYEMTDKDLMFSTLLCSALLREWKEERSILFGSSRAYSTQNEGKKKVNHKSAAGLLLLLTDVTSASTK